MRKILHYAWVVAGITWFTLLAAAGFRSTPGVLIVPLQHEFGWSRATISIAVSINLMLFGLFAPFAGGLMERFGVRRVVVGALLTVSAGSGLTVFMQLTGGACGGERPEDQAPAAAQTSGWRRWPQGRWPWRGDRGEPPCLHRNL